MKQFARLTAIALMSLAGTMAFAADGAATKLTLELSDARTIAGTKLAPGSYKVLVDRTGDTAKVRIFEGKKEVVNTTAQYHEMSRFAAPTALSVAGDDVREIQSAKLKGALVFNSEKVSTQEGSSK